jgi:glycogen debranching enzyme
MIAWGFKAYGFEVEAAQIARDISEAGSYFYLNQLPELYSALSGDAAPLPVQYLGANVPQAWAAGSVFMLMQAMLGFLPDAPRNKLYLDPSLPAWLPDLTVRDLRIGKHMLEIRFSRKEDRTEFEVLKGDAGVVERCDLQEKLARFKIESEPI